MFLLLKEGKEHGREKILFGPFSSKEEMLSFAPEGQQYVVLDIDDSNITFYAAQKSASSKSDILIRVYMVALTVVVLSLALHFLFYHFGLLKGESEEQMIIFWLTAREACSGKRLFR